MVCARARRRCPLGLPAAGGISAAVEYFVAADAALDLDFQAPGAFNFGKTEDRDGQLDDHDLTFDFTIGYKMYKAHEGKVTTFIEPALELGGDTSNFSTTFHAGIGAVVGAEYWVAPQFALGGGVGLALDFTNKFKDFDLHTFNTGLFASFFWN